MPFCLLGIFKCQGQKQTFSQSLVNTNHQVDTFQYNDIKGKPTINIDSITYTLFNLDTIKRLEIQYYKKYHEHLSSMVRGYSSKEFNYYWIQIG